MGAWRIHGDTLETVGRSFETIRPLPPRPPRRTMRPVCPESRVTARSLIRFADLEIDRAGYELRRGGKPCPVEPQVFELLAYLADNPDRLITKDELIEKVWGGRIVSDAALASRIKSARKAIGDDGAQQRLIKTVHGRGVRFVGTVEIVAADVPQQDGQVGSL